MVWNTTAEIVSLIFLAIIWVYSHRGNMLPTLKNKLFHICLMTTFIAIMSNVISTILIYSYLTVPLFFNWLVATVYFVMTPLMGVVYFFYVMAFVYEGDRSITKKFMLFSIPAIAYLVLVLINPYTKWLFDINYTDGYTRGPYIILTYVIFYLYCFCCLVLALAKGSVLDRSIRNILASFPIIAGVVIVIQQFFPEYILSGSAATCALLIIYLYLQNKQIYIDHLTGLSNRQDFLKMLEWNIGKHPGRPFTITVFSLRDFKTVNDKFGQQCGDLMLRSVAEFLATKMHPHNVYRYSGDEFAVLMENADEKYVSDLIEKVSERMHDIWDVPSCSCMLSFQAAVVLYPHSAKSVEHLIDGVESTISQAKKYGRNTFYLCTQEMLDKTKRRSNIIEILRDAIKNDSFDIYYQPILSLDNMKFERAEALMRLNETPLGPIYPSEFIPIAEDTGLVIDLTYSILDRVCKFVRRQLDMGKEILGVGVNFSSKQFTQDNVSERVFQIINENNVPYESIKIEITESALLENYDTVKKFVDDLDRRGVQLALDDFGVGYSNIAMVIGFPINIVKLDKSLVWSSINNPRTESIVRHMTAAFTGVGLNLLAEGVETQEHLEFIKSCGCSMVQGFLFSKPMPEHEAEKYLCQHVSSVKQ